MTKTTPTKRQRIAEMEAKLAQLRDEYPSLSFDDQFRQLRQQSVLIREIQELQRRSRSR
jgi:hypothetical protein